MTSNAARALLAVLKLKQQHFLLYSIKNSIYVPIYFHHAEQSDFGVSHMGIS